MLTLRDVDYIETTLFAAITSVGETGGVSLMEAADMSARFAGRLCTDYRALLAEHECLLRVLAEFDAAPPDAA